MIGLLFFAAVAVSPPTSVEVSVLTHAVARGDRLAADDFGADTRSPAQGRGALPASQAAGQEATRNLAVGSIVRASDVIAPRLVRRGEPVTITVRAGSLSIATAGRALGSGGTGDLVRVVITATNRTLDGTVVASGEVRVASQ